MEKVSCPNKRAVRLLWPQEKMLTLIHLSSISSSPTHTQVELRYCRNLIQEANRVNADTIVEEAISVPASLH